MASIYLPPIARKKKVSGWPRNDTSRVFADFDDDSPSSRTSYNSHFVRHNVPPTPQRALSAGRKNKPQPMAVSFLRQNPRFVCEPICHVETAVDNQEISHPWWPNELLERQVKKPLHSMDSTSRADYTQHTNLQQKGTRFSCNPNKSKAAAGIIPECGSGQLADPPHHRKPEKISYEHQYNSRLDPNEPMRGRRHGCFIWKPVVKNGRKRSTQKAWQSMSLTAETTFEGNDTERQQSVPETDQPQLSSGLGATQLEIPPTEVADQVMNGQEASSMPQLKADTPEKLDVNSVLKDKVLSPPPHVV